MLQLREKEVIITIEVAKSVRLCQKVEEKMFSGEYAHNLDAKGRITIPAKFREFLGNEFVITKGTDKCLMIFPMDMWNEFTAELQKLPRSKNARDYIRHMVGSAEDIIPDKMGRGLLSQALINYASLEKEVVLVGTIDRIEIWDKASWDKHSEDVCEHIEEIGEELADQGFYV